jgi:hypothetical protein
MRSTRLEHWLVDVSLGTRGVNGDGPFLLAYPEGLLNLERRLDRPYDKGNRTRLIASYGRLQPRLKHELVDASYTAAHAA